MVYKHPFPFRDQGFSLFELNGFILSGKDIFDRYPLISTNFGRFPGNGLGHLWPLPLGGTRGPALGSQLIAVGDLGFGGFEIVFGTSNLSRLLSFLGVSRWELSFEQK